VIFTDDLLMKGVTNHFSLPQAAFLALKAGADNLLVCRHINKANQAYEALCREVSGPNSELKPYVEKALARVQRVKKKFGLQA
jgi:beta-N-acetylhexosaminidase